MNTRTGALALGLIAGAASLAACSGEAAEGPLGEAESALSAPAKDGKHLFDHALPGTNGRSCATCHVQNEHTALSLENVAARFASDPTDPLFDVIDADDPSAATPTFDHLRAGLVRVTVKLADNLDLVDAQGNVVTGAARTVSVWRSVPTVENTAYTAPYQYDGRAASLEEQAGGALAAHSQIDHDPSPHTLEHLAAYERTVFSSAAAAEVADAIEDGRTPRGIEPHFHPGSDEARGQALFAQICTACHGGPTVNQIINQDVHDQLFPVIHPDGSIAIALMPDGTAVATQVHHDLPGHHAVNLGIAFGTYLGQIGALPNPTGVDFPRYRVRFYQDASRTQKVVDLPPPPPLIGPTNAPQAFSVDPGRAIITGDPNDWEAFDVPQLRGVAATAPYFHDGSAHDLKSVLDLYSRFILPAIPQLHQPLVAPPEGPGLPPESLTVTQKAQLIAYLNQI
jgi:cytochrome c peroxidase